MLYPTNASTSENSQDIAFVDKGLANVDVLLQGFENTHVVLLDDRQNGIDQITSVLAQYNNLDSIQIFSHGSDGTLQLGNAQLSGTTVGGYSDRLNQWKSALSEEADLLFYGCNLAATDEGVAFIGRISELTGADVAASNNLTGIGGDWQLEVSTGLIESHSALSQSAQIAYEGTLELRNGDFESGLSSWSTYAGTESISTTEFFTGSSSLQLSSAGSGLSQLFNAVSGGSYSFTGSAKSSSLSYTGVGINFLSADYEILGGSNQQVINREWDSYQLDEVAPEGSRYVQIWAYKDAADGDFFVDSLAVDTDAVIVPPQPPAAGEELLQDTGFESGLGRWGGFTGSESVSTVESFAGGRSLQISAAESGVSQFVEAFAGEDYIASTYAKSSSNNYVGFGINFFDVNYNLLSGNVSQEINSADWQAYESTSTAPTETAFAQVWFYKFVADGDVFVDEVSFSIVEALEPEPGAIGLQASALSVDESAGSVTVTVQRTGGSDGEVTVDYSTVALSGQAATADVDYASRSGRLTFADGETAQSVEIPVFDDAIAEGPEAFGFAIDNVQGGATLLAPRTAQITIIDDDSGPTVGTGNGLRGEYYDNIDFTNLALARTDATVDFDWASGSPDPTIGVNTFSVRWSGQIEPLYSETYTFQVTADDGIQLRVNNQLLIDKFFDQPPTTYTGTIDLVAGERYDIQIDYYENGGGALSQLAWSSNRQPFEVVPQSQLYSDSVVSSTPVAEAVVNNLSSPTAIDWRPNSAQMFIAEKGGRVEIFENGELLSSPFIDISAQVNGTRDRGLLDIALHPDFENNPYVYLLFTYDPPEVFNNTGNAGPDGNNNRASRLIRVTADATNGYRTAVAGSEVVLLGTNSTWDNFNGFANSTFDFTEPEAGLLPDGSYLQDFLNSDSESHTIGSVEFGPDGALYVSNGDGASYNRVDPRATRVQDVDSLSGKVLRIDPITGAGLSDNPFYNGDASANRSKVYQLGLRNPFRMTIDQSSGQLYIGDVGWTQWEEINAAGAGANFGWPYYEGGSGVSTQTGGYQSLAEAQAFYNSGATVTPSLLALNHGADGINAIVMGDLYTGSVYDSKYQGDLFFNDLGQGIVRNVSFDLAGNVANVETFTTGAAFVVQMAQGPDELMYYVNLVDGTVGRWVFA